MGPRRVKIKMGIALDVSICFEVMPLLSECSLLTHSALERIRMCSDTIVLN